MLFGFVLLSCTSSDLFKKDRFSSLIDDPELGTDMNDGTLRRELPISFGEYVYILRYVPDYDLSLYEY